MDCPKNGACFVWGYLFESGMRSSTIVVFHARLSSVHPPIRRTGVSVPGYLFRAWPFVARALLSFLHQDPKCDGHSTPDGCVRAGFPIYMRVAQAGIVGRRLLYFQLYACSVRVHRQASAEHRDLGRGLPSTWERWSNL